jgi:hypothetical protein
LPERDERAHLYRSRVKEGEEVDYSESELVGKGSLEKMVRVALTDPDDEVWRYCIRFDGSVIVGDDIRET